MEIATSDIYDLYWQKVDYWAGKFVLPDKFKYSSFENLPNNQETELLKAYDINDEFGFLLYGQSGIGKTYALCALLNKILWVCHTNQLNMSESVAYYPTGILLQKLRDLDSKTETFEKCQKVKFLFLDDLGTENVTDFAREALFTILDVRCQQSKPTFITSNLNPIELKEKYGERVTSRFKEMCVVLELKGQDKRTDIYKERVQKLKARINATPQP